MSYDSKLEGLLALAISMSTGNASDGLNATQNAEQDRARNMCELPKDMRPSREAFEALGFKFEDIGDDVLYQATLPEGWTLESDGGYWTNLVDDKGRKRGNYFYKGAFYDRNGHMALCQRFGISFQKIDPNNRESPINVYAVDCDGTIIFEAGHCKDTWSEYEELERQARGYLDSNYPGWEDETKYWD